MERDEAMIKNSSHQAKYNAVSVEVHDTMFGGHTSGIITLSAAERMRVKERREEVKIDRSRFGSPYIEYQMRTGPLI